MFPADQTGKGDYKCWGLDGRPQDPVPWTHKFVCLAVVSEQAFVDATSKGWRYFASTHYDEIHPSAPSERDFGPRIWLVYRNDGGSAGWH